MGESLRKNIRLTHEMDFTLKKYQRAATIVESFEGRFKESASKMKQLGVVYDDQFREINKQIEQTIPD